MEAEGEGDSWLETKHNGGRDQAVKEERTHPENRSGRGDIKQKEQARRKGTVRDARVDGGGC